MRASCSLVLSFVAGACSAGSTPPTAGPVAPVASATSAAAPAPERSPRPPADSSPPLAAASAVTARVAPPAASAASATPDAGPAPIPPPSDPPLPKGTVVLHVGDSMADALGKDLKRQLDELGIKNVLKYQEATYIPQWASDWDPLGFRAALAQTKPDLVIITLGGNEVAMPDPSVRAEPVRRMVAAVGDRPCVWIAAPLWPGAPQTGILEVIRNNCAPCIYVDTNKLLAPPLAVLGDRVHPTIPERRRWASFMIRWLRHNRDPNGKRPWDLRQPTEAPPTEAP